MDNHIISIYFYYVGGMDEMNEVGGKLGMDTIGKYAKLVIANCLAEQIVGDEPYESYSEMAFSYGCGEKIAQYLFDGKMTLSEALECCNEVARILTPTTENMKEV